MPKTATADFLKEQIAQSVAQSLGVLIGSVDILKSGEIHIKAVVTEEAAKTNKFWQAVLETFT